MDDKLHELWALIMKDGTQEMLDIMEDIETDELQAMYADIINLRNENTRLKNENDMYKRAYGSAIYVKRR